MAQYASYDNRLSTLLNLPRGIFQDIREIAWAGLYYLNGSDENSGCMLRCAFCEFLVGDLKRGDDVWELHASYVPICLHLICCKGLEFVKMVLEKDECNAEALESAADMNMYAQHLNRNDLTILGISGLLVQRQQSASSSPSSLSGSAAAYRTYGGVPFSYPKNIRMVDPKGRMESFSNIQSLYGMMLDLKSMAEAGFYFTGAGDSVKCYHCGEGFKNWNRTDDPWIEHARHVPYCMHVILTKGEEFVSKVRGDIYGLLKRHDPSNTGVVKRKMQTEDEGDSRGKKKRQVYGLAESSGVERCQRGETGPVTVSAAKRLQNCLSCRAANREHWDRQESDLQAGGDRLIMHATTRHSDGSSEDRSQPSICAKCNSRQVNMSTAVGSICCHVLVCESCYKHDGHCPVCNRT